MEVGEGQALGRRLAASGVTRREADVFAAVGRRLSNAEIAAGLCISKRTVESHVSSLLAKLGLGSRAALGEDGSEIARLVPQLRRRFSDLGPPLDLPAEQGRRYLFNAVRDTVARAAGVGPVVIVLEDLHWADEATLLLLEHVAETVRETSVLLVGTHRDSPADVWPLLAHTLDRLVRQRLVEQVRVGPLSEAAVGEMLANLSGQDAPVGLLRHLHGQTQGNPFFVEE